MKSEFGQVPEAVKAFMMGRSYRENPWISLDDLRYIRAPHIGFDGETHMGEMISHKLVAEELAAILDELYEAGFPIEKMRLIDHYEGSDDASMADNNSSCFCYRTIAGSNRLSLHAKGLAVDINPLVNPYVTNQAGKLPLILPPKGAAYLDRSIAAKGLIVKDDACCRIFAKYGFYWGGQWTDTPDYHHFEKRLCDSDLGA